MAEDLETGQVSEEDDARFGGVHDPELARALEGHDGVYRIAFRAMVVEGLPEIGRVDDCLIFQTTEPLYTRQVDIVQQNGLSVVFRKRAVNLEVGASIPKTVCVVPFTSSGDLRSDIEGLRERALTAVGIVAVCLDERLAFEELFEDFSLFTDKGEQLGDTRFRLRTFLPCVVHAKERDALAALEDRLPEGPIPFAARWYLKAVQLGPVPDAIVFYWVAIEALVDAEGKDVVRKVKARLDEIGADLSPLVNPIGRLYGLRAEVVHLGQDHPELLGTGYYDLEGICRLLLRAALAVETDWPPFVREVLWPEPVAAMIRDFRDTHRTFWDPPIEGRK